MSGASWDQWNANQAPRYPHESVVQFVRENFSIPVAAGAQALDLGSGNGVETRFLMECGFDVTAIDSSAPALERVSALTADLPGMVSLQQSRLADVVLPARTYSCAICVGVLDAAGVDEARIAMPRVVDALKPGGKALLVLAAEGDFRLAAFPELGLHGFSRREVEALIVLEYGAGVWIDSVTTTAQNNTRRQIDWVVTIAKR